MNGSLYKLFAAFFLVIPVLAVWAQQARPSPLGVLIEPRPAIKVEPQLRALLPRGARVRILAQTALSAEGETLVVYDRYSGLGEPNSHVVIIRGDRVVEDFALARMFKYGYEFTCVGFVEFRLGQAEKAAAIAFRNVGDGSATLFVVLKAHDDVYKAVFSALVQQGRLRIHESERARMELWSAREALDEGISCTWCDHRYEIRTFVWRSGNFVRTDKKLTRNALKPYPIAERPLVMVEAK